MRMLLWHVNSFRAVVTERGRSPLADPKPDLPVEMGEGILVFACAERADEADPALVARRSADEVASLCRRLKAGRVTLHSFAHLFAELAAPDIARQMLRDLAADLSARGLEVYETPFGWFNTVEIATKGHPLSRQARTISAGNP